MMRKGAAHSLDDGRWWRRDQDDDFWGVIRHTNQGMTEAWIMVCVSKKTDEKKTGGRLSNVYGACYVCDSVEICYTSEIRLTQFMFCVYSNILHNQDKYFICEWESALWNMTWFYDSMLLEKIFDYFRMISWKIQHIQYSTCLGKKKRSL